MARATGIGGVFFKSSNPEKLRNWYVEHLGLPLDDQGYVVIRWGDDERGSTVWAPFPAETTSFSWPTDKQWVINYRVDDIDAMVEKLEAAGVFVDNDRFEDENGRFAHCWDPEGNRIQLWEPNPGF